MYLSNTIKTDIITVTPDVAKNLLELNTRNRKLSSANYNKVREAMSAGEWELNGEAIKIATDGRILDGQHRLQAAANEDLTFQTLIVYGLPSDTQDTMDTGKSRSAADVLSINGYKSTNNLASIVAGIIRAEKWDLKVATYHGASGYPVTPRQVLARVEAEPSLTELVARSVPFRKIGLSAKLAGILYYELSKIDQEDADYFFNKLESGEGLTQKDAILTLREALIRNKSVTKGILNPSHIAALTIKAWNKYRAGEPATLLRYTPGGANPEKFPHPI